MNLRGMTLTLLPTLPVAARVQTSLIRVLGMGWPVLVAGCFLFPTGGNLTQAFQWLIFLPCLVLWLSGVGRGNDRGMYMALMLAGYLALSHLWAVEPDDNPLHFAKLALFAWAWFHAARVVLEHEPQRLRQAFWLFVLAGAGHALYSMLDQGAGAAAIDARLEGWGMLRNPIRAATLYGMVVLAAVHLLKHSASLAMKATLVAAICVAAAAMLLTQSRGPVLMLVPVLAYQLWRQGWLRPSRGGLVLFAAAVVLAVMFAGPLLSRMDEPGNVIARLEIWQSAIAEGTAHPLLGEGLTRESPIAADGVVFKHSHNTVLETFRTGGAFGVLLLLAVWVHYLRRGLRAGAPDALLPLLWLGYGLLTQSVNGMIPLSKFNYQWFVFWLPPVLIYALTLRERK